MSIHAYARTANRPVIALLWALTLFALVPFSNFACVLGGAAANLTANGLALFLLCSRSRADRVHGVSRLALQLVILIVGAVVLARSGVTLDGLVRFATHPTP